MVALFDTYSLERALSVPTDPRLRQLLTDQIAHLHTVDSNVCDTTYFLIVDDGTTLDEIDDELGWSPLIDLAGNRFGEPTFAPFFEHLEDRGGWYVLSVTGGNDAVYLLFIQDSEGVPADLLDLCRGEA